MVRVAKGGVRWADTAVADWTKRIKRWGGVDEVVVRPERFTGDVDAVRIAEAARIGKQVRGHLVAMDERGDDLDTHGFAELVDRGRQDGRVTFVIGGPYGLDASVRRKAWRTVRLSSMVLNHEVARVVLFEQLYRGLGVLHGSPYHH